MLKKFLIFMTYLVAYALFLSMSSYMVMLYTTPPVAMLYVVVVLVGVIMWIAHWSVQHD